VIKDINAQLGEIAAFRIMESADRQESGEVHVLISEEFFELKSDEVEIEDFVKSLDKDAVIDAAVLEFRATFTELITRSIENILDED
jgi:hypothetical protein